jgi:hypothetical protein
MVALKIYNRKKFIFCGEEITVIGYSTSVEALVVKYKSEDIFLGWGYSQLKISEIVDKKFISISGRYWFLSEEQLLTLKPIK